MSAKTSKRSLQARGPLDTSTPKHEQYSVEKKQDENFENISYESDHTEPRLSPVCSPNSAAQKSESEGLMKTDYAVASGVSFVARFAGVAVYAKAILPCWRMTQSAVKKGAVAQAAPSVKKNGSRRRSRSRSRSRNIRRSTPTRTIRSTPDTKVPQFLIF
ncbi:unnamed protein product [Gongylonema pulchrum]|uniref:DUF1279 domain-containing protein n=1 Tax=Gongylonema pulchrum TaxID=637853 RepID=A0A183EGL1_9BILA|nr:unnamed protein product [Gongylonema pulchrum]